MCMQVAVGYVFGGDIAPVLVYLLSGLSRGNVSVGLLLLNCQYAMEDLEVYVGWSNVNVSSFRAENLRGPPFSGIIVLCRHGHRY